jgi:hypothetical protein
VANAPVKDWADLVIGEMSLFPKGKFDDLTDSATQAINYLRANGMLLTDAEIAAGNRDKAMYRPTRKALYPA